MADIFGGVSSAKQLWVLGWWVRWNPCCGQRQVGRVEPLLWAEAGGGRVYRGRWGRVYRGRSVLLCRVFLTVPSSRGRALCRLDMATVFLRSITA